MASLRMIHQVEKFGYLWIDCVEHCDAEGGDGGQKSWYKWRPHVVYAADWSGVGGCTIPINTEVWPSVFVTESTAPTEVFYRLQLVPDCTTKTAQSRVVAPGVAEVWIRNVIDGTRGYDVWYVRQIGYDPLSVHASWAFVRVDTEVFEGAIPVHVVAQPSCQRQIVDAVG
jgi:hypothetical protein